MASSFDRRDFLKSVSVLGMGCACLLCHRNGKTQETTSTSSKDKKDVPNPDKLAYCGHECNQRCDLLRATTTDDVELKKKVFKQWRWKERFGVEFKPEIVFCHGCKVDDQPIGLALKNCTIRKCAMKRKLACCIQCKKLKGCKDDFWTRFPKFKEHVEAMQKKYVQSTKSTLL